MINLVHCVYALHFQVKVFFSPMKEAEPNPNLERSKSADNMICKTCKRGDEYTQPRSQTSDKLWVPQPQAMDCSSSSTLSSSVNKLSLSEHSIPNRVLLVPPDNALYNHRMGGGEGGSDTASVSGSTEGVSLGGFSDDDLSDTESDNEWDGCEVTQVWPLTLWVEPIVGGWANRGRLGVFCLTAVLLTCYNLHPVVDTSDFRSLCLRHGFL